MCSRTPQLCTRCCTVRGLGGGRCCCLCVMLESVRLLFIYQLGGGGRLCWRYTELRGVRVWSLCRCMCVCTVHVCPPSLHASPPCPFMSSWHRERETEEWISDVGLFVFGALVLICGQNGKRSTSTAHAMWLKTVMLLPPGENLVSPRKERKKTAAAWVFLLFLNDD